MNTISNRHVLVITYYWPPSGGPGVQRILKFVKYLDQLGWNITVLTVKNGEYPVLDERLENEVPEKVRVVATSAISYYPIYKRLMGQKRKVGIDTFELTKKKVGLLGRLARWIRMNYFIPDARIGWVRSATRAGRRIIATHRPDVILSSSPPHSLQLIAKQLAEESGIPWVADFRDPWTKAFWDVNVGRSARAQAKNASLERQVVRQAKTIIGVSRGVLKLLNAPPEKTVIIPNGYDEADFVHCPEYSPNNYFTIAYAGYMAESQNPSLFFEALSELSPEERGCVRLDLYGKQDAAIHQAIERYGVGHMVRIRGYVPHDEAVGAICQAEALLLVLPKENGEGILTGKLFEYLATGHFILGIGDPKGEASAIIKECRAGVMIDHTVSPLSAIEHQIQQWRKGERFSSDRSAVVQYSRKALTEKLSKTLATCI